LWRYAAVSATGSVFFMSVIMRSPWVEVFIPALDQVWPEAPLTVEATATPALQIEAALPSSNRQPKHKGGRPPEVHNEAAEWCKGLKPAERELSSTKLAEIYKSDNPGSKGEPDSIRKIIDKLRREETWNKPG
jgi:hypothetical protein